MAKRFVSNHLEDYAWQKVIRKPIPKKLDQSKITPIRIRGPVVKPKERNQKDTTTTAFKKNDDNLEILHQNKNNVEIVLMKPVDSEEFRKELQLVCIEYDVKDPTDWWAITEAENRLRDNRLISLGLPPVCSDTRRKPVLMKMADIPVDIPKTLPKSLDTHHIDNVSMAKAHPLEHPIALIREWKTENGMKEKMLVAIMKTVEEFRYVISALNKYASKFSDRSIFSFPLSGKDDEAASIFNNLVKNCALITRKEINSEVNRYNSLYPTWAFIKVEKTITMKDKVSIPYERKGDRTINDVNLNLKDIDWNTSMGICPLDKEFCTGMIPGIVADLVRGALPDEITSVAFHSTIAVNGKTCFEGFRVRITVNNLEKLSWCKEYFENDFIRSWNEYLCERSQMKSTLSIANCIVRISIP